MPFKKNNPGCNCCEAPPDIDWVSIDDDDNLSNRIRSGPSTIWTNTLVWTNLGGCAYAPDFDGAGVILDKRAGTGGLYEFDIATGADNGLLSSTFSIDTTTSGVFNQCNGVVCVMDGFTSGNIYAFDNAGATIATYGGAGHIPTTGCVRRSNGDLWRSTSSGGLILRNHSTTTRLDLTGVAVTSTSLWGLTGESDIFYVLGFDADPPDEVELFRIDPAGPTATLLTSYSARNAAEGSVNGLTKIGDWLFWSVAGDARVWRYSISGSSLEMYVDAVWGGLASPLWVNGFFAPR